MSAIAQIVDWINEPARPIWWKHAIRLLIEKQKLDAEDHKLLYQISRKEAGFPEKIDNYEAYLTPISSAGYKLEEHAVTLKSLGPIYNISALANDQVLEFSRTGLTVVYGDNGSGKSSLSKILKNACLTRGEKPVVIGNAFFAQPTKLSASISYQIGEAAPSHVEWEYKSDEITELKSIRVFDAKSAFHYLEKEGELDYRPAGLHLLDELVLSNEKIRKIADDKIKLINQPLTLPTLEGATSSSKFLKSLSHKTTSTQLDSACISGQETLDLESLKAEIFLIKSKSAEELRKTINLKIKSITPFADAIKKTQDITSNEFLKDYIKLCDDKVTTHDAAELARAYAFSDLPIENVGSPVWKSLWTAAESFFLTTGQKTTFPPQPDTNCPLCLQKISDNAGTRLARFEAYAKDQTQTNSNKASKALADKILVVKSIELDLRPYESIILQINEKILNFKTRMDILGKSFSEIKSNILNGNIEDLTKCISEFDSSTYNELIAYSELLQSDLLKITDDDALENLLLTKQNLHLELNAKKSILENKTNIESEIQRLKQLQAYSTIKSQTNPRSITLLSGIISDTYLTASLKDHFTNELKELGFKNYTVAANTRSSNGSQLFKISLAESNSIGVHQIASEGEQKCLALASILAELKADNRRSGVIFDDPVNSLDHKWRLKIARRLIKESIDRQVIIFTHEIVFLKLLLEESETVNNSSIQIASLDRSLKNSGIVKNSLPWDALPTSKRITQLEELLRELRKTEQLSEANYNNQAGSFYGYLREAWERLVEEKLLNKVVERFGRAIQTNRLKRLKDISDEDIELVESAMSKCSALFKGHDTAPGLYESMPDSDEIENDIKKIKDFDKELSSKRKRS
ncbi:AAA family ATPase [Pseudomonas salomonii]|uniref:AAA domain-containing protein n=1 Tax=Pseudomonas salomonii TaxID=191391 RepID=A0A1H3K8P4_9PSED|nr:AAA family ATPase [Pseudomonas salomonii]SDY48560.1 AAA domain-containing protein [Pseudomonas salomonii]